MTGVINPETIDLLHSDVVKDKPDGKRNIRLWFVVTLKNGKTIVKLWSMEKFDKLEQLSKSKRYIDEVFPEIVAAFNTSDAIDEFTKIFKRKLKELDDLPNPTNR